MLKKIVVLLFIAHTVCPAQLPSGPSYNPIFNHILDHQYREFTADLEKLAQQPQTNKAQLPADFNRLHSEQFAWLCRDLKKFNAQDAPRINQTTADNFRNAFNRLAEILKSFTPQKTPTYSAVEHDKGFSPWPNESFAAARQREEELHRHAK